MIPRAFVTIISLLAVFLTAQGQDAPAEFTHARFVDGERSMKNLVEFPDIDSDIEIDVICSGQATAKGRLKYAKCSSPGDIDLEFTMAVSRRFNSSRLIPATVDGNPEEVDFQFIVAFRKEGDNETIAVYTNNGKNVERLGLDYLAAQRYSPWVWPTRCRNWRQDDVVVEVAIIDMAGRPKEVKIMSASGRQSSACITALSSQLDDGRWIPASHKGQFVDAVWVNPIVLSNVSYKRQQN